MRKEWIARSESSFELITDEQLQITMNFDYSSSKRVAQCRIGNEEYLMTVEGFWSTRIEVRKTDGTSVARITPQKWYANTWNVLINGKTLTLGVRNNPLAEYYINDGTRDVLAYGLDTNNGTATVRISSATEETDPLLDAILWYLFLPLAKESMGDNFTFMLMLVAAIS